MSWKEVTAVEERVRFMQLLEEENSPGVAALCREFAISRKTAYKWIGRYRLGGQEALKDLSRAAHTHPNAVSQEIEQLVISTWSSTPKWGAKKLCRLLHTLHPGLSLPCRATISAILDRNQLVMRRKRSRPVACYQGPLSVVGSANDVWAIDHKGWWLAGNGDIAMYRQ